MGTMADTDQTSGIVPPVRLKRAVEEDMKNVPETTEPALLDQEAEHPVLVDEDDNEVEFVEVEVEDRGFFTATFTAWALTIVFGVLAPLFGVPAFLDMFPTLLEGLRSFSRAALGAVDVPLLGVTLAAVAVVHAIVFSTLIVCVGKRPGFGTGSALAVFLLAPTAIVLGVPAAAFLFG